MSSPIGQQATRQRVGDFEIVREIGRGGMGVVYEARQVSLNRPVALKVLGAGLGLSLQAVQRFHREAEAAARLHHTNIVPVYATGEQDGTYFYAMELIEGPSLNDVIRQLRQTPGNEPFSAGESATGDPVPFGLLLTSPFVEGPVTPSKSAARGSSSQLSAGSQYFDTVARLMADVAEALEYAHTHGVIHRDIKPANLLLAPDGRLSVNDFGLARVLEQPGMTMTGEFVGTPAYMSPEQIAAGRTPLDHRTDIYSLGATLYELLTLRPPFAGERRDQVLAQILHKEPVPPRRLNPKIPPDLQTICLKAMEKDPDRRYPTAKAMAEDLRRYLNRFAIVARRSGPVARLAKFIRRHKLATTAGIVILLLASAVGVATGLYYRAQGRTAVVEKIAASAQQINWAHDQLPVIEASVRALRYNDAFELLQKVQAILPESPRLVELRTECSWEMTIVTDPPGATVSRKPLDGSEERWEQLGVTPIENRRLSSGAHHWKFEKNGFATAEGVVNDFYLFIATLGGTGPFRVELDRADVAPQGMVRVRPLVANAVWGLPNQNLPQFWIDRFEVTNRQFKLFVDQGGYRRQEFWEHPFEKDGKAISWDEAMSLLRDKTGQPGPATWVQGSYPDAQDEFPVSGVSWYEAAAYAKFAGKSLPTVYHWTGASGRGAIAEKIVPRSNLEGAGPARVGQFQGLGPSGTYDMVGNVKEWCWNSAGDARRYILGGAWDELNYRFSNEDVRAAMERDANMGFRCVKHLPGQEPPPETFLEIKRRLRDYLAEPLLSDDAFRIAKGMFDYDRQKSLKAVVERQEETTSWVHQRVAVDTAYGSERLIIHLFLPREVAPPYQSVIYWPHGGAQFQTVVSPTDDRVAFLIRSGRALVMPVYKGTYDRKSKVSPGNEWWERTVQQVKDFSRSIDYLQTRKQDFDLGAIGYYGVSWGAADVRALAIDNRIKAAVFVDGGLHPDSTLRPERHVVNYLPRITIPVLMLNGRFDSYFPPKESQEPMFKLLGADPSRKAYRLSDSSHVAAPSIERIQDTVSWFDRYLGPVNGKGRATD